MNEMYAEHSFDNALMRRVLPKSVFEELELVQKGEKELTLNVAEVVAAAMRDWALEKGATHFTHWFHPLTGLTAEKHDSFITPTEDGVIMEFSGKELIKGEPDASSFPHGGLRDTFEARGYTAWDTTSPAFLKRDGDTLTLTIPTVFFSYTGEALDKKVPLLRSMEVLNTQTLRVLRALGNTGSRRVYTNVGPEQEYFLIDKKLYDRRLDLKLCGRTVLGACPSKGQELSDHYFGSMKERCTSFMNHVNRELWKLGVSAKTQHNEVAPNQFELATIFENANIILDHNQLVMDTLKKVAERHGLVCLLHEKPFAEVNGSGKHNNWSIGTDDGINLLRPGKTTEENTRFLLFLSAVIRAIDEYAPLLRASAANAGNDHRLGGHEAPPAIISVYLGTDIMRLLENYVGEEDTASFKKSETVDLGLGGLSNFTKDNSDRNRTSPFAFSSNKFEFRMLGSSQSLGMPNTVLNTITAFILEKYADRLESCSDPEKEVKKLIQENFKRHKRVIFNGNGYSEGWVKEAAERGLPNIPNTIEALKEYTKEKNVEVFVKQNILNKSEIEARMNTYLENYSKQINIEALTLHELVIRSVFPAVCSYINRLEGAGQNGRVQRDHADLLQKNLDGLYKSAADLRSALDEARETEDLMVQGECYSSRVIPAMNKVREFADHLETLTDRTLWPFPVYADLLFTL